jgi:hypothetical protein
MTASGKQDRKAKARRRLSTALRQNLKRRKAQARAREGARSTVDEATTPHDSAGIAEQKQDR